MKNVLNIALPKGRLGESVYEMFAKAGFECPSVLEKSRKLIFENDAGTLRYFWNAVPRISALQARISFWNMSRMSMSFWI